MFARLPRWTLYAGAAVIQIALLALMVYDRATILREGREIKLQTRPVDPRDFLRGDYVQLAYDMSNMPAGALKGEPAGDRIVYVLLAPDADGFYRAVSVHRTPPAVTAPDVLIMGRAQSGATCGDGRHYFCDHLAIHYGIERYFVPQGEGREIESARNQGKVTIVAAVTPSGRAAIKRLMIDGKAVYDEPLF
jgi:uncharacterized membrane-anchored protein